MRTSGRAISTVALTLALTFLGGIAGEALADPIPPSMLSQQPPADSMPPLVDERLKAFALDYNQATDWQEGGFIAVVVAAAVSGYLARDHHPDAALSVMGGGLFVDASCLVESWIAARKAACELCPSCGECPDVLASTAASRTIGNIIK